ncbi:MAG TPA: dienelactone hydrolase family protein [Luteitalea sp.]|nr:dienelactone hydrolase family protein [Luteitalea sp.]
MERKTAADFDQELLILFDAYVHGDIDRRGFLERASKFAVGGMTAAMILEALNPRFAEAQQIAKDDPRLVTEFLPYPSPQGYETTRGYLVKPKDAKGKLPGIVVVHENRGLNPHIEDVARRFALEGYVVFAPDALASLGGYPGDEDKARAAFQTLDQAKTREDMLAAFRFLKARPECTGKVGVTGFCYGGGIAHMMATKLSDLAAAVPFYGNNPTPESASTVKAPLLIHLAEKDERINAAWPTYEAALKAAGASYTMHMYAGAQHGFHNDTTPRYDEASAKLAWQRTLEFFGKHLRA